MVTAGGFMVDSWGFAAVGGRVLGFAGGPGGPISWSGVGRSAMDLGRSLGIGGREATVGVVGVLGAASCDGLKSRSLSGLGPGDIGLEGGCEEPSCVLLMFSKRARREETGFWECQHQHVAM